MVSHSLRVDEAIVDEDDVSTVLIVQAGRNAGPMAADAGHP